ncbi:MAG: hypothetical protein ACE15E_19365 [Acidobacteriota bacterium]
MKKGWICLLFLGFLLSSAASVAQKWQQVGVIEVDAFVEETVIQVDDPGSVVVDRAILIERRDGKLKDTYEVLHVYGHAVLLKQRLRHDFVAGSRVYQ